MVVFCFQSLCFLKLTTGQHFRVIILPHDRQIWRTILHVCLNKKKAVVDTKFFSNLMNNIFQLLFSSLYYIVHFLCFISLQYLNVNAYIFFNICKLAFSALISFFLINNSFYFCFLISPVSSIFSSQAVHFPFKISSQNTHIILISFSINVFSARLLFIIFATSVSFFPPKSTPTLQQHANNTLLHDHQQLCSLALLVACCGSSLPRLHNPPSATLSFART